MQNAGQYVPGAANAHPPQQFVPSESSPNGGSTTSSLRQFRKRDVDKSQLEQPPKQESHVARVAPHNHYPPVSNDLYRYPPHQFSDYSPQVKYSDIADPSQSNPISTSVIQKPKPKEYMEMCNVQQQQHLNNQQQYSPDNGQYMHRDPTQGYPTGFKPDTHYVPKDQHQYQQLPHHTGQPKFNPTMMTQNMRKYNPGPADNPFLNKLSKIHPTMARSIISDHHLQDPQPTYSPMDQRTMYGQQNHRYYPSSLHQPNPYAPNPNYPMNAPHHYPNYPSSSCNYPRTPTIPPRYSHMERSISPTRRGYPENMHMNHLPYHNMPQKMPTGHNYSPQYAGAPEYAQHYQHRRMAQDCYPQPCRPTQFMPNHHQIPVSAQEMQELPESRISPSDSLKKFIENWAADEEPSNEINAMEGNMNLRDGIKVRDDAPPGTVYMINATDVQYFENNGIPIVTSDNGGLQLTSENYQYLLKNGLVDNSGMVRIIEANKEISIDASGNHERVVNLQIMETSKSDCMMVNKTLRPSDGGMGPNGVPSKPEEETRRVVIHQNTIINPANCMVNERIPNQQPLSQASSHDSAVESISISKELVDKNCSPINLDQLEHNLGFSEPDPPETENENSSVPVSVVDSNIPERSSSSDLKPNERGISDDHSQNSDDGLNKSPGSKSMPIIDLFGETHVEESEAQEKHESDSRVDRNMSTKSENNNIISENNLEKPKENIETSIKEDVHSKESSKNNVKEDKTDEVKFETKAEKSEDCLLDLATSDSTEKKGITYQGNMEPASLTNSVIVSPEPKKREIFTKEDAKSVENSYNENSNKHLDTGQTTNNEGDNISNSLNSSECKVECIVEKPTKQIERPKIESISENVHNENTAKYPNETPVSTETPTTPTERRKRIFSVDDIIHHIGNNLKRRPSELDIYCSVQTINSFIEKEIEFSSLEQIANINFLKISVIKQEEGTPFFGMDEKIKPLDESKNNFSRGIAENYEENKSAEMDSKIKVKEEKCEIVFTEKSANKETENQTEEIINNNNPKIATKCSEMKSVEDCVQTNPDPATTTLDSEERSNTPSVFQFRNAIRVEEPSVLLQIAGELMEISVNIVNGKKVITVVPLSETTVVDYNDNYEISANIQPSEVIHASNSVIESDRMDISEVKKESCEDEAETNCVPLQELKSGVEEKPNSVLPDSQENQENALLPTLENIQKIQPLTSSKIQDYDVPFEKYLIEIQEQNKCIISFVENTHFEPIIVKSGENKINQEIELETESGQVDNQVNNELENTPVVVDSHEDKPAESSLESTSANPETVLSEVQETLQQCEITDSTMEISEVTNETNIVDNSIGLEVFEPVEESNIVEIYETPKTPESIISQLPKSKETENLKESENDITTQREKESQNSVDVVLSSCMDKNLEDSESIICDDKILKDDERYQSSGAYKSSYNEETYIGNTDVIEHHDSDLDPEHLEYQLEDDVFISEEPSHEIIISDPLEGVGLVEEIDKTSDSFDIPLEPVTASDEILESPQLLFEEKLKNKGVEQISNNSNRNLVKDNIERKSAVKEPEEVIPEQYLVKTTDKLNSEESEKSLAIVEKNKEFIVKLSKPEIQILSPTSTNIEDSIPSKENIYLEPRSKFNSDDDLSESASATVTTKAAKKLYECDLQIPAVTTSGDVNTKVSKKSLKYQHDTVTSSKKERVLKESRSKKSTLKRSKRINEKNQIKNEQKEMLRILAEKRKQRKESKQREAVKQTEKSITEKIEDEQSNLNLSNEVKNIEETKQKNSTEQDDEYVDFKELLRARKLKKLKKMQEMKRREIKEHKSRIDDPNKKNITKDVQNSHKKVVKETKPAIVTSSRAQENKPETQRECCIGCMNSTKKSNIIKDDKQKTKKRKNSSEVKVIEEAKEVKHKNNKSPKTERSSSDSEANKSRISAAPLPVTTEFKTQPIVDDEKSINETKPVEPESKDMSQEITKTEIGNKEDKTAALVPGVGTIKKEKPQKRVSFCDDISSSTSHNENYGASTTDDKIKSSLDTRVHCTSISKDPRKRSKSYSGQIIVPSVSELIEENGATSKKKISLADYVSRKRKASTECSSRTKPEENDRTEKKRRIENSPLEKQEFKKAVSSSYKSEEDTKSSKKTLKDVKTSFVIHSSDWEDSQSPIPRTVQSNEECLIQDFSGLIKSKTKKPVIDVNELNPSENLENPKDKKLQEYKDKVESQLSSLNIQIPKVKSQNLESKSHKNNLCPFGSPENSSLIKKFLSNEKITQCEMEKIKKIISYKRLIQDQKNARSPSKSPGSSSSTYSQSPAGSSNLTDKSPANSGPAYSGNLPDPTYEVKNRVRSDSDLKEMRLHLKKVNAKRKIQLGNDRDDSSSVCSKYSENKGNKKNVDYSVINRLGKDGLPKIIFKRNRQSHFCDGNQLVVELERIDDDLEKIEEKYNVTVTQMM